MPLLPGGRWVYEERSTDGEVTDVVVEVLDERRTVMGVSTSSSTTWRPSMARSSRTRTTGSPRTRPATCGTSVRTRRRTTPTARPARRALWEAGVGGAFPGIVMPAEPEVTGKGYRQEYLAGTAEDMGEVIAVSGSASTPFGDFDDVIVTRDWTPLEPDAVEEKTYARGVGVVSETSSEGDSAVLVEFTPGT